MEKVDQYILLSDSEEMIYHEQGMAALMDELEADLVRTYVRGDYRRFKVTARLTGEVYGYETWK